MKVKNTYKITVHLNDFCFMQILNCTLKQMIIFTLLNCVIQLISLKTRLIT